MDQIPTIEINNLRDYNNRLICLPKYWVVKTTKENIEDFITHVISYLDEIDYDSCYSWLQNITDADEKYETYYGFDGSYGFNGTNAYKDLSDFENDPTILTLDEFIELRSKMIKDDMVDKIENKEDIINNPTHYGGKDNVYEAIKVIEAWDLGFRLGNTVKYISRAGKKEKNKTIQDLEKARYYLDREIMLLKGEIK